MNQRFGNIGLCAVLVIATVAFYSNTLQVPFVFDDFPYIAENAAITGKKSLTDLFSYYPARFVAFVSFAINHHFGALDVSGYHLVNIALHCGVVLNLFFLLQLLAGKKRRQFPTMCLCAAVALIFALHPIQTQAVTYIWQRVTVLATLLCLLSMNCLYLTEVEFRTSVRRTLYGLGLLFGFTAMFTKQIAFCLPFLILAIEIFRAKGHFPSKIRLRFLAPYLLLVLVVPLQGLFFGDRSLEDIRASDLSIPGWQYILTQGQVFWLYLRLVFLPSGFSLVHDVSPADFPPDIITIIAWTGLVGLVSYAAVLWRKGSLFGLGIVVFLLCGAVEFFTPLVDLVFEHRIYFPLVGGAIGLFACVRGRPATAATGLLALAMGLGILTYKRNQIWNAPKELWRSAIEHAPNHFRGYVALAELFERQGNPAAAEEVLFSGAERVPRLFNNLGALAYRQGAYERAIDFYGKIRPEDDSDGSAVNNIGICYARLGHSISAVEFFRLADSRNPGNPEYIRNLGHALSDAGQVEEAVEVLRQCIEKHPRYQACYSRLAAIYESAGNLHDRDAVLKRFQEINSSGW